MAMSFVCWAHVVRVPCDSVRCIKLSAGRRCKEWKYHFGESSKEILARLVQELWQAMVR